MKEIGASDNQLLVVPGRSFARNLQSRLVGNAHKQDKVIGLPEMMTTSRFLQRLLQLDKPVASEQLINLTTATVLRGLPDEAIAPIIGSTTHTTRDLKYWLLLAKEINEIVDEFSTGLQSTDPTSWPDSAKLILTNHSESRMNSIHTVRSKVIKKLEDQGFCIPAHRWLSVSPDELVLPKSVVLLGMTDMHAVVRNSLKMLLTLDVEIESLIFAPETRDDQFDEFGCVLLDAWSTTDIDIPDDDIDVAGSPSDQANRLLQKLASLGGEYAPDEITIAVTDPHSVSLIRRQLDGHDVSTRYAVGKSVISTPEATLLSSVGDFVGTRSL